MSTGKLIAWLIFGLGACLFLGGIYVALSNIQASTTIHLFGQDIKTSSVGFGIVAVGVIMVVITFRKVLAFEEATGNRTCTAYLNVCSSENSAELLANVKIQVLLMPTALTTQTDETGRAEIFFSKADEGETVKLIATKPDFEPFHKQIKLSHNRAIAVELVPEKKKIMLPWIQSRG